MRAQPSPGVTGRFASNLREAGLTVPVGISILVAGVRPPTRVGARIEGSTLSLGLCHVPPPDPALRALAGNLGLRNRVLSGFSCSRNRLVPCLFGYRRYERLLLIGQSLRVFRCAGDPFKYALEFLRPLIRFELARGFDEAGGLLGWR